MYYLYDSDSLRNLYGNFSCHRIYLRFLFPFPTVTILLWAGLVVSFCSHWCRGSVSSTRNSYHTNYRERTDLIYHWAVEDQTKIKGGRKHKKLNERSQQLVERWGRRQEEQMRVINGHWRRNKSIAYGSGRGATFHSLMPSSRSCNQKSQGYCILQEIGQSLSPYYKGCFIFSFSKNWLISIITDFNKKPCENDIILVFVLVLAQEIFSQASYCPPCCPPLPHPFTNPPF